MTHRRSVAANLFDRIVLAHPVVVIVLMSLGVLFLAMKARHFRLDASAETLVLENDESLRYARLIGSRYEKSGYLVLTYTPQGELFSDENLETLARLRDDLQAIERTASVLTILDVPLLQSPPLSLKELTSELPTLESPKTDRQMAKTELRESPLYRNLLISPDGRTTALLISFSDDEEYVRLRSHRNELRQKKEAEGLRPAEEAELEEAAEAFQEYRDQWRRQRHRDIEAIREIMGRYRSDAKLFLGGVSMIADDMITFIKNDLKVFGLGVLGALVITLGIIFKSLRWIVLPLLCCMVSVVCMIGLLGWFGWEVTVISSNFVSLQLIITMAIAIHLIVRYRELHAANPKASHRQLIGDTIRLKFWPCLFTVLTTIAGFASLLLCDILPVITFGWMMIGGLIVSLVITFLLFPAVLGLLDKHDSPPIRRRWFSLTPLLAKVTQKCGGLVLIASVMLLAAGLIGIAQLEVENSFIDYFREDTEIYQGMKLVDQQLGGTTPLDVIIDFEKPAEESAAVQGTEAAESDPDFAEFDEFDEFGEFDEAENQAKYWFTAEKVSRIKEVHRYLESLPQTGKVMSLANIMDVAEKLNDGEPLDSLELALLYSETPEQFRTILTQPYVSVEHDQARFWVRVRDSDEDLRRNELLHRIRHDLTQSMGFDAEQVHLTGMLVLYNNMLQSLFDSQILTLGLTMLILTAVFLILFRSLKLALLAMAPNVLPVTIVLGLMGWLDIPLDMMTITIAAIAIGISVDDTIHYIHRFRREFHTDHHYMHTMQRCHASIGYAMYYTSVTIMIGFSILALSNFIPTVYFGLLTGLAMLVAMVANLTLLPRLIVMAKPFGKGT